MGKDQTMQLRNTRRYLHKRGHAALGAFAVALVTFSGFRLHFNSATVVLLYVLIIVWQSLTGGFVLSASVAMISAVCLDFFFLPPLFSLRIADPLNLLAFFVFVAVALVITRLVSRLRAEADWAERRSYNLEQLYGVARHLLLVQPDHLDPALLLKTFRDGFAPSAACLYKADTGELHIEGVAQTDLLERTRTAYLLAEDEDDERLGIVVRCLRAGNTPTGAIGFEGLPDSYWVAGPLTVFAAAALEQARAFRKASHETAAAQAEVFRTAILDALAHEFKTPLATILAVAGGLRESQRLGTEEVELAGTIELEASRLSSLANRLLRMARLDREEVKPRMRNTNIHTLVQDVVDRYASQSRDRQVEVTRPGQCGRALADRELLDLAITQLLDNAFKYSAASSAVTVGIKVEGEFIVIRVRNEGSSIAVQEQDRVFEQFYRGTGVSRLVSGAGLGLYVARKIAVAHGGSLELDKSTPSEAVVFNLKLPRLNTNGCHHVTTVA
jgi:two-component system, OmpR family, sensor histidine kinase KdpD